MKTKYIAEIIHHPTSLCNSIGDITFECISSNIVSLCTDAASCEWVSEDFMCSWDDYLNDVLDASQLDLGRLYKTVLEVEIWSVRSESCDGVEYDTEYNVEVLFHEMIDVEEEVGYE